MNRRYIHVFFLLISIAFTSQSCSKDEELDLGPGVNYLPYYSKNTYGFNGSKAINRFENAKNREAKMEAETEEQMEEIATAVIDRQGGGADLEISDPWIPPATRRVTDMAPALRGFPKDGYGYPDWSAAVAGGLITPKGSLYGDEEDTDPDFDEDILFLINDKLMANVMFPHKKHTYWLSCKVCHPGIFIDRKGANDFSMYDIWNGKFCGRCHGKVSYQPKGFNNCQRCHSVRKGGMSMGGK